MELPHPFCYMKIQEVCNLGEGLPRLCWHPDLRIPASRAVINKSLLLVSHWVCHTWLQQPEQTKTIIISVGLSGIFSYHLPLPSVFPSHIILLLFHFRLTILHLGTAPDSLPSACTSVYYPIKLG